MEYEDACNTGLSLDLGLSSYGPRKEKQKVNQPLECLATSTKLLPKEESIDLDYKAQNRFPSTKSGSTDHRHHNHDRIGNDENGCTKKLRLTKEQSALLEDSFHLHSSLNTFQKQSLAEKLNLRPRQVEVWFQNRRARTKLKQTEIDREFLRKWCEKLSDENRRLKKEVQELRAIKVGSSSLYIQLSKSAMCSSCEKPKLTSIE